MENGSRSLRQFVESTEQRGDVNREAVAFRRLISAGESGGQLRQRLEGSVTHLAGFLLPGSPVQPSASIPTPNTVSCRPGGSAMRVMPRADANCRGRRVDSCGELWLLSGGGDSAAQ